MNRTIPDSCLLSVSHEQVPSTTISVVGPLLTPPFSLGLGVETGVFLLFPPPLSRLTPRILGLLLQSSFCSVNVSYTFYLGVRN